jgi:hypothetical protein
MQSLGRTLQQGIQQFMQSLGKMFQPGHWQGATGELRNLQQHTRQNKSSYYNEDPSHLTSVPGSCYAPSSKYCLSDFVSSHEQYQHGD